MNQHLIPRQRQQKHLQMNPLQHVKSMKPGLNLEQFRFAKKVHGVKQIGVTVQCVHVIQTYNLN